MKTINDTNDNSENDSEYGCRRTKIMTGNRTIFLFIKKKIILPVTSFLTLVALPQNVFSQANVSTDKLDYIPGEYVQIAGANWQLGETVRMIINEEPVIEGHDTVYATADGSGNIFNNQYMIAANDIGQSFTLTATGLTSGYVAQARFTDGVDFRQSANNDAGYGMGNIHWINSILQNNNSKYYEGMSSLQRIILTSVGSTTGNVHRLTFSHQSIKSSAGSHAYDFMTSWPQGQTAADAIAKGQGLFTTINQCGPGPSSDPGGILALCAALHASAFFMTPTIPDAMGTTLGDNVATRVAAYETVFGDRTLKIYGNAALSAVSVTFDGYTGTDLDANYTLTWTSSSSSVLVEFAGHIGVGEDPLLAGIGYGTGKGAGAIPGGPYHVHLNLLDGHSLGSQDNQIKAADILIPPPVCSLSGPNSACEGATNLSYVGPSGTGFSYGWALTTANGATFCSATNTQTVCVNAGTGSFTLQLTVTGPGGSTTCEKAVSIFSPPVCSINDPLNSGDSAGITCNSPGGSPNNKISTSNVAAGNTYLWEILTPPSGWSITSGQGTNQIHFTSGVCVTTVTVQLTITDVNGCISVCTKTISPTPFVSHCNANAGIDKLLNCSVTSLTLSGSTSTPSCTADDGTVYSSTYLWAGPGIVNGGSTLSPMVNALGTYTLTVTVFPGVGGDVERSCAHAVSVTQNTAAPSCAISGVDPTCSVLSNNYSGPNAPSGKSYTYSWTLTGAVNASLSGSASGQTVTVISGTCNASYTLDLIVTDQSNGCSSECSKAFGFEDKTPPSIGAPEGNSTINCPAEPQFTAPLANDACGSAQIVLVKDTTIGNACSYIRTKTWKAVDACGNSSNLVSQSITVHDVTNPTIGSAGTNTTINCPGAPQFTAPHGNDECSSVQVVLVKDTTIGNGCNYVRTKTWKAVDACGNSSNLVSQSITVHDVTNPSIGSAGTNTTINCPGTPQFTAPVGNDECGSVQVVLVKDTTIRNSCNYVRTKTWKAVDGCGNSSNLVSQSITVHDVTAPVLSGEGADVTLEVCSGTVRFTPPTATDECDPNPVVNIVRTDTIVNGDGSITYRRIWSAVDACQNISAQVDQAITVPTCTHEFCSLTQGFYGSGKGVACATGERGNVLIVRLLSSPFGNLVIGKPGRSLTIDVSHASCIIARLPAGGKPVILPSGDQSFNSGCATTIQIDSRGKFVNVLLGQTITLGLNMRLDPDLDALILKGSSLATIGSHAGSDGLCGTTDDTPNSASVVGKQIPLSVLNALTSLYSSRSVANLFDLANRALGGLSTGGASISQINQAVSAINEGFDGCRFLRNFEDGSSKEGEVESVEIIDDKNITMKAIPNPFSSSTILEFTSKADAKTVVEVYNIEGAKVATLFNADVKADETHSVVFRGDGFADGIYIYRVTTGNRSYYQKLILAK